MDFKMNERIKELLKQATKEVDPYDRVWVFSKVDQAKFAELIVRECTESLWTEECYNSDLALEEFERNSAKIKKHFGVEE
jgi:hypothetical protein